MKFRFFNFLKQKPKEIVKDDEVKNKKLKENGEVNSFSSTSGYGLYYDGNEDTNLYLTNLSIDYKSLATLSYQMYLKNTTYLNIINLYVTWICNKVRFEIRHKEKVLKKMGLKVSERYKNDINNSFTNFTNSKYSMVKNEKSLIESIPLMIQSILLAGDILIILKINADGKLEIKYVDGRHVCGSGRSYNLADGNKVVDGVEINADGKHIAYYIIDDKGNDQRVKAYLNNGLRVSYLVGFKKYRETDTRHLPLISGISTSLKNLDDYTKNMMKTSSVTAKFPLVLTTSPQGSVGSPFKPHNASSSIDSDHKSKSEYDDTDSLYTKTAEVTGGVPVVSLLPGQELKTPVLKEFLDTFEQFSNASIKQISASAGVPYTMLLQSFNSNYSASRAELKVFEVSYSNIQQAIFPSLMNPIFSLFLFSENFNGSISTPGYQRAFLDKDKYSLENFGKIGYIPKPIFELDPAKHIRAIRESLGTIFEKFPISDYQTILDQGDVDFENILRETEERFEMIKKTYPNLYELIMQEKKEKEITKNDDKKEG